MKRTNLFIKQSLCVFLMCITALSAYADRIKFTYDSSGNRILRQKEIIIRQTANDSERKSNPMLDDLVNHRITIYPNPTQGDFSVEISGAQSLDGASITIYNASGSIIYYNNHIDDVNSIDLTPCANGIYLLVIRVEGESSSWKVIKI